MTRLRGRAAARYRASMGLHVQLPPDLESYARSCVDSGRFASVSEVVGEALRAQRDLEARRAAFVASLEEAVAEGERDGFLSAEEVRRDVAAAIEETVKRRSA